MYFVSILISAAHRRGNYHFKTKPLKNYINFLENTIYFANPAPNARALFPHNNSKFNDT